jgi:hypothetical protein
MLLYKTLEIGASPMIKQAVITTPLSDLYPNDRRALAVGPTITVKVGDTSLKVPKRAAMAISPTLNQAITDNPTAAVIMLNPAQVQTEHIATLIKYIDKVVRVRTGAFTLTKQETFVKTVDLYRHALLFGMDAYVKKLFATAMDRIHERMISSDMLEAILKLPSDNRMYVRAVQHFEGLLHAGKLPMRKGQWIKFLDEHVEFKNAIEEYAGTKQAEAAVKRDAREDQRKSFKAKKFEEDFPPLG